MNRAAEKRRRGCASHAHIKEPRGYLQWHEWVAKKARRHRQLRCPECGKWKIWIRRDDNEADWGGEDPPYLEMKPRSRKRATTSQGAQAENVGQPTNRRETKQ